MGGGNGGAPAGAARLPQQMRLAAVLQHLVCQVGALLAPRIVNQAPILVKQQKSTEMLTMISIITKCLTRVGQAACKGFA